MILRKRPALGCHVPPQCVTVVTQPLYRTQYRHFNGSVGLVGVPNVGKSLFFNILNKSNLAITANYPFCTIEPNISKTTLPDTLLPQLAKVAQSEKIVFGTLDIRDIAGLIKGAHKGAGMGNLFLRHIRDVSVIVHVIRCFTDQSITQISPMTPTEELEIVTEELVLADMDIVAKRLTALNRSPQTPEIQTRKDIIRRLSSCLESGLPGRVCLTPDDRPYIQDLPTITTKPAVVICNINTEDAHHGTHNTSCDLAAIHTKAQTYGIQHVVPVPLQLELEILTLSREDPTFLKAYLEDLGIQQSTLSEAFKSLLHSLGLSYYYTVGEMEAKAWFYRSRGTIAEASGAIHSTFPRLVTTAEICDPHDFLTHGSWDTLVRKGLTRTVGRDLPMPENASIVQFRLGKKAK